MQISAQQRLFRLAAGSIFAAGTVFIPVAVVSAHGEGGRVGAKAPRLPDIPTDPAEGVPVPFPPGDG